ncbi:unannotated protein [freshwater metagenome]|uniref:Unannotated protein n=1 Tax=freshwater metagenome TaxID=449393 RepID=A0A6J7F538_9ZZZZ|nr:hypothetical protein [Actinomycetota bacterium]
MSAGEPTAGGLFGRIAGRLGDDAVAGTNAPDGPSFSMADLVLLPAEEAALARFVLRADEPPTVEHAAAGLQWAIDEVHRVIGRLSEVGAVELADGVLRPAGSWRIQRRQPAGIWSRLADL